MHAVERSQPADERKPAAPRLATQRRIALPGPRARLGAVLAALALAALAALLAPPLALLPIVAAGLLALWDRVAFNRELRSLAAAVAADGPAAKLEVGEGALGELCHAVNRLQQQRHARRQMEPMLPVLPVVRAARLADAGLPPEGLPCEVAVLAIAPAEAGSVAQLREAAQGALRQAQAHEALLSRGDGQILLIFGVLQPQSPAAALRAAGNAARDLLAAPAAAHLRLALAVGPARTVVLPGLGLNVLGQPVEQAIALCGQNHATTLLCAEDAYLGLRRIGAIPPHEADPRLALPQQRPVYPVQL